MTRTSLRPASASDDDFLKLVYASTRTDELAAVPWTDDQKQQFLSMQFRAQDASYRASYPDATFDVVELDGVPIGRLLRTRLGDDELRIIDIALLPEHRNRGLGTELIHAILEEADRYGLTVSLHVEVWNPARALYERLGFHAAGANDVHVRMEHPPH